MKEKLMFIMAIIFVSLSISSVCASDVDNQTIQSIDQITSAGDVIAEDVKVSNDVNDSIGSFSDLQNLIKNNDVVNLTKDFTAVESEGRVSITKNVTINGNGHVLNGNEKTGIFRIIDGNVVLNNITIKNGKDTNGGAVTVFADTKSLTFNNCTFLNNHADDSGGSVYLDAQKIVNSTKFINCNFEDNLANLFGGAIFYKTNQNLVITNCTFKSNKANNEQGGAVYSNYYVNIEDSIFKCNSALEDGGAIYAKEDVKVENSLFDNNRIDKTCSQCFGGAIASQHDVSVVLSTFLNNFAECGGAIFGDCIFIYSSNFANNTVSDNGGAVYAYDSVNAKNSVFENNRADAKYATPSYGGAIASNNDVNVDNCKFLNNHVPDCGGAIYGDTVSIYSSCFNNNYVDDNNGGAVYSNDHVIIEDSIFVGNNAFEDGGAVLSYSANVKNSIFENNFAYAAEYSQCYGGAIKCADIEVYNSSFLNNHAGDYGGAIYAGSVLIRSSCFKNNYVEDNCGGAVYSNGFKSGIVDISDSIFSNNRALVDGGAIYSKLRVSLKNSTFINNAASGASVSQCCGGAISSKNNVKVDNSTFINNHADDYGGAIYADTVTWVESVSYFVGNFAEDNQGGAIYTNKFNTDVIYGIFIGNQAKDDDGGAIYINKENHITFSRCTFKDNYAADEGGAIYVDSSSSVITLKYYNSFINNHAGDEGQVVFNKGKYGEIKNNWWGTASPDFSEDLLVEWKAVCFNEMHEDSNPLYKPYEDYFIKSSTIQNSSVQTGNPVKFNDAGAIYNIMQDIKGLSILNSNLMHGEYIINSLYNGFNVSDKLTMV